MRNAVGWSLLLVGGAGVVAALLVLVRTRGSAGRPAAGLVAGLVAGVVVLGSGTGLLAASSSTRPTAGQATPTETTSAAPAAASASPPVPRPTTAVPTPTPSRSARPMSSPPSPQLTGRAFSGTTSTVDAAVRARMPYSWRAGCPVPLEDLRLLTVSHWGFDGAVRSGELVVHRDTASSALSVLRRLFEARFPIQGMQLVDVYGADDNRSMVANNTSAFNCRAVTGRPGTWSQHSYGRAIDLNPVQNPYVVGGSVLPPAGRDYVDRSRRATGMVHAGDATVRAFAAAGWSWGGSFRSLKDYQHFSTSGG